MSAEYRDRWIECTDEDVVSRGYYFPLGVQALIRERAGLPRNRRRRGARATHLT